MCPKLTEKAQPGSILGHTGVGNNIQRFENFKMQIKRDFFKNPGKGNRKFRMPYKAGHLCERTTQNKELTFADSVIQ